MTPEEKSEAYDKAIKRAKNIIEVNQTIPEILECVESLFPELKENCEESIRKWIIDDIKYNMNNEPLNNSEYKKKAEKAIAWLEKQSKETSWKPSKEEMDVLYGLAYSTNQYDEHKEEVITRLYQDLKREFFNGASYENMFPTHSIQDEVRRRSTIQVLEYARSLDNYNQYGKADIDKNIAWLEKQGNEPNFCHHEVDLSNCSEEYCKAYYDGWNNCNMQHSQCKSESDDVVKCLINGMKFYYEDNEEATWGTEKFSMKVKDILSWLEKQGGHKPDDKAEPKFHKGEWIIHQGTENIYQVVAVIDNQYQLKYGDNYTIQYCEDVDRCARLWTIQDAKDGDVLACNEEILLFKSYSVQGRISLYCWYNGRTDNFHSKEVNDTLLTTRNKICPATKEQRGLLFQKMKEAEWDFEKKELKKIINEKQIKQNLQDNSFRRMFEKKPAWSEEDGRYLSYAIHAVEDMLGNNGKNTVTWLKSIKERIQPQQKQE